MDRPRLTADAIPTVSDVCRSLTVITPEKENGGYCFKDHFPKVRKNNLNDIFSVTDPDFPDLVNDFVGIQKQKIKSNGDLISFLDCFIKDSKWVKINFSKNIIKYAYFPLDSPSGQSVVSINLDVSIDISLIGQKSNLEFFSLNGKIESHIFYNFFLGHLFLNM